MNKIILSDRMYVDKKLIPLKAIEKRYKVELYSEKDCVKCENLEFRSPTNELCKTCPAFLAAYRLYKEKDNYWSLPQGDFLALKKVLEKKNIDFKVVEKRKSVPFKFPIKFTGKLFGEGHIDENGIPRINQKILIKQYLKKKNGILVARPRAGKCVSGNSIISTSEGMLSIKELFNHYGYSDLNGSADVQDKNIYIKTRIGHEKITHFFSKWSKENYALKTKRGYSLTGTPEHPVLVIGKEGIHIWKRMDELCEGDYLCIQKNVPIWPKNNYKNITVNESKLLGYLTANGNNNYILNKNAAFIRFTSKNKKIIKDFISCLPTNVKIKRKVKSDETINIIIYDKAFRLRMVDLGLKPVLSAEKTIPLSVRKSSKNVVDAFLSGYLSCDSYITKSGIGLSSASKILIRQLQNLLLNYGVYVRRTTSKISWARNSKNPSKKRYFGLSIGRECSRKLLQNLNLLKAYGHLISNEGRTGSGGGVELNYIPYTKNSISRRISRASLGGGMYNVNGNQPKRIGEMGRCKNSDFTREMFSRFDGNKIHDISIKAYMAWKRISSETDFVYDKIVSIKKIGKKKVYDLTVPGSHSFIANGIVVHNTVLSTYVSIKLGERTCILANRKELIKQFYNTFMGDKSKNRKPMSNIPELQKKTGKEIIRIVSSPKDFKNLENVDILLCFPANTDVLIDYDKSMTMYDIYRNPSITEVLAYDLKSKKIIKRKILNKIKSTYKGKLYKVFVKTKYGEQPITCTPEHPFYVRGEGWVAAKDLQPGDKVISYDGKFERNVICKDCGKLFTNKHELAGHRSRQCNTASQRKFKPKECEKCGKFFKTRNSFTSHIWHCRDNPDYSSQIAGLKAKMKELRTPKNGETVTKWEKTRRKNCAKGVPRNKASKPELEVIRWQINNLKYTGLNKAYRIPITINGKIKNKIPDFVYPNKENPTKVVEVMDLKYWHSKSEIKPLKKAYAEIGIDCIVLNASKVRKNPKQQRAKVEAFLNNHDVVVTKVYENRSSVTRDVYNIEVEKDNNYFVIATKGNLNNYGTPDSLNKLSKDALPILVHNCNYQKLVRKPKFMAKVINGNYNHLIVDEVHGSAAEGYLRVISNCSVMYRMGLSATPRRKDNRHKLVYRIMGNIAAKSESASLIPKIELFFSKVESQRSYKMWPHAFNWICSNLHLQKEILQQAFKDLRSGHEVIIIPLDRRRQIDTLVSMINKQAKTNNRKRNENWPKNLAIPYYDGVDRDKTLAKVDKPGPTILVAMRSMIKEGIDFARPSILYSYLPVSASTDKSTGAPLFEQLSNRVCTPFKKPQPVVRVWVFNNIQMFRGCISGLGWRELAPNKYNEKTREGKYKLDKDFFTQLKTLNIKPQSSGAKNFDWV